jgi:hypothetical protein
MSPASYQTAPPRVEFLDEHHRAPSARAGNGTRTRDPNLGKVVLYQLSYSRSTRDSSRPTRTTQRAPSLHPAFAMEARGIEPLTS